MMTTSGKILTAGILGFIAGIVYAPRKGTETQEMIKEKFEKVKTEAATKADRAKEKIRDIKQKKSDSLDDIDRTVDKAVDQLVP